MPTPLPARNIFDGTANPTTSAMKSALGSLRDYLAEQFGTAGGAPTGVASLNGGPLAGLRNRIINGNFAVNQRAVSGTVTLGAGGYGHDRWKAGASGCTYTFATVNNITTLTISAGSLLQVIEGVNLDTGTHVLSWSGTAQGKIGAGGFAATGVTGSVTGGVNTTVEFGTGTLSRVQLESDVTPTAFERRPIGLELTLCQRYYELMTSTDCFLMLDVTNAQTYTQGFRYAVPKRATPNSVSLTNNMTGFAAPTLNLSNAIGMRVSAVASATAAARIFSFAAAIDSEL